MRPIKIDANHASEWLIGAGPFAHLCCGFEGDPPKFQRLNHFSSPHDPSVAPFGLKCNASSKIFGASDRIAQIIFRLLAKTVASPLCILHSPAFIDNHDGPRATPPSLRHPGRSPAEALVPRRGQEHGRPFERSPQGIRSQAILSEGGQTRGQAGFVDRRPHRRQRHEEAIEPRRTQGHLGVDDRAS